MRAGQSFQLDIPVSGEPPPDIFWDFEGKPLESDDRVKINNIEYRTKFVVKRALRSDTGIFNITAKNDSGMDTAPVKASCWLSLRIWPALLRSSSSTDRATPEDH